MLSSHSEAVFSLKEVANSLPNRPNISTIWRWAIKGVKGHKLVVTRIGGRAFVTEAALAQFMAAVNGGSVTTVSSKTRAAELSKVNRDLDIELS
jgi:hypothetical protein